MITTPLQYTPLGVETQPAEINDALKALWKEAETATRASLINLAIYSEEEGALEANTESVYQLTLEHACRVLLIEARHASTDKRTEAWVTAHCSLGPDGRRAVCCEQLAFRMHGVSPARLTNLLFANLDSDLPLALWWQASLTGSFDQRLYSRIERLIIDSQSWDHAKADFERLLDIYAERKQHFVIHDLNWTRTFHLRLAIAAGFEDACALQCLNRLSHIEITHATGYDTTAYLLASWLLERLSPITPEITFKISPEESQPVSKVSFHCGKDDSPMSFSYEAPIYKWQPCPENVPRSFPADRNELSPLLIDQLGRGGNNAAYLRHVRRLLTFLA